MKNSINYYHWANQQWIHFTYDHHWPDEYLTKLMNHIIKGERAWIERMMGIEWNRDLWNIESRKQLLELRETNQANLVKILAGNLETRIPIKRLTGQEYNPTFQDIIQHILSHGDHHRGQMAKYVASISQKAPLTDYMTFCIEQQL